MITPFAKRAGEVVGHNTDNANNVVDGFKAYEARLPPNPLPNNAYHPFRDQKNWEIASWAKTYGIGANALTALLKIPEVS